jgi:short subunit dehydrogenase-like uncharacterized protein
LTTRFLLYGATGYTGKLLARSARARGLSPVLCGRSVGALRALASELALEHRVAALDDARGLDDALKDLPVLLNAAGPFSATSPPLVDACLRAGAHYLDVSGEVLAIDGASRRTDDARRRRIMLMPAIGFDVVASDCLAAHATRRTRSPRRLFIGISGLVLLSRGSAMTIIQQLTDPVWVRRGGVLTQVGPGSLERVFDYGDGPRASVAVSWGDVASAYFTTGVPDITVYFEATPAVRTHTSLVRAFGAVTPLTAWKEWLRLGAQWLPEGPTEQERAANRAVVSVEVEDDRGEVVRSDLRTPEAYSFTASAAIAILERALAGDLEPGFQTPARVYGPEFVLSLPGVSRADR